MLYHSGIWLWLGISPKILLTEVIDATVPVGSSPGLLLSNLNEGETNHLPTRNLQREFFWRINKYL